MYSEKESDSMTITKEEYSLMVDRTSPKSRLLRDCLGAFFCGVAICTVVQALMNLYLVAGFAMKDARCLTSVTLVLAGAVLTALGWYDNMAKIGGAGTLVPITGFSNAVCAPAIEFKSEGFVPGTGAKMFIIAGPVIVYGTVASIFYGFIYYLMQHT